MSKCVHGVPHGTYCGECWLDIERENEAAKEARIRADERRKTLSIIDAVWQDGEAAPIDASDLMARIYRALAQKEPKPAECEHDWHKPSPNSSQRECFRCGAQEEPKP